MGETRVDLLHLLEDLRDAYPGSLGETILTEIVANSLDSGARRIAFATDLAAAALTVVDDGRGMTRAELRRYHDLAASAKQRGRGIGFAGVGIKLGLLACESVLTESRRGASHVATQWHLKSRHRAPWQWVDPPGLTHEFGTAVRLTVSNALSELLDDGFIESVLHRHFQPLFEPEFAALLDAQYPNGIRFLVNARELAREPAPDERIPVAVRLSRRRKPAAAGYVFRSDAPLAEAQRGIAISTLGKVIKRGWDWLGMTPAGADHIGGLIDAPALADCLTLNKADFLRTGPRGAAYLAYRKAIQEALAEPLAAWGAAHEATDDSRRRRARPLERDLREVLDELARDFPLLSALTERRTGGQRRFALGSDGADTAPEFLALDGSANASGADAGDVVPPAAAASVPANAERLPAPPAPDVAAALSTGARKQRAHLGLRVDFEHRVDDPALGRLVESTIWVNEAHPAYRRAQASRQQAYHLALTVAMTLAPLAVEAGGVHTFVGAFLEQWGAVDTSKVR